MAITFGEIKQYISRTVRISVCFRDGHYDNYTMISDIVDGQYDDLYVYGIGMADVEFPLDVYKRPSVDVPENLSLKDGFYLGCGLEIVLQDEPRDIPRQDERLLHFHDLRGYLQIGTNFSVVMREDWSAKQYTWRKEIPEKYNDLYVYGIGIEDISMEDIPKELQNMYYEKIKDMRLSKKMVIVLAKTPRADVE